MTIKELYNREPELKAGLRFEYNDKEYLIIRSDNYAYYRALAIEDNLYGEVICSYDELLYTYPGLKVISQPLLSDCADFIGKAIKLDQGRIIYFIKSEGLDMLVMMHKNCSTLTGLRVSNIESVRYSRLKYLLTQNGLMENTSNFDDLEVISFSAENFN